MLPPATRCWIVSDGKAGDEAQCLGVAEALGLVPELRRVAPGPPWVWAMPWGPIPPSDRPDRRLSPLAPPFPDLAIGSGRRAVAYLRHVRKASGGRCFTVCLKDPRSGTRTADLIWVPDHDRLRGANVVHTLTSPHRITPARLAEARARAPAAIAMLPAPRAALLLGGDSRHYHFTPADCARLAGLLGQLGASGVSIMASASRRSPAPLIAAIREVTDAHGGWMWEGTGANPYLAMLACCDAVIVTADSVNMVDEACVTGKPVLVFEPTARAQAGRAVARLRARLARLVDHGAVRFFQGRLESYAYDALDSTPVIAAAVEAAFLRRNRG